MASDQPLDAVQHEQMGEIGEGVQDRCRGEKRADSQWLLPPSRNSPSKVPGSVFFYGSDVSEDFDLRPGAVFAGFVRCCDPEYGLPEPSVFFGTSGVPGDGCAADELGADGSGTEIPNEISALLENWLRGHGLVDRPAMWFWHEPGDVSLTAAQHRWVLDHGGFHVFHIQKGLGSDLEIMK